MVLSREDWVEEMPFEKFQMKESRARKNRVSLTEDEILARDHRLFGQLPEEPIIEDLIPKMNLVNPAVTIQCSHRCTCDDGFNWGWVSGFLIGLGLGLIPLIYH